jgi:hypothetical protein
MANSHPRLPAFLTSSLFSSVFSTDIQTISILELQPNT